ncbi:hypothetical protein C8J56DRAFT_1116590 [Mycena floridula]|nr:hypothetical protein C8J56DRAFT_1116590 [Mycena floridula]
MVIAMLDRTVSPQSHVAQSPVSCNIEDLKNLIKSAIYHEPRDVTTTDAMRLHATRLVDLNNRFKTMSLTCSTHTPMMYELADILGKALYWFVMNWGHPSLHAPPPVVAALMDETAANLGAHTAEIEPGQVDWLERSINRDPRGESPFPRLSTTPRLRYPSSPPSSSLLVHPSPKHPTALLSSPQYPPGLPLRPISVSSGSMPALTASARPSPIPIDVMNLSVETGNRYMSRPDIVMNGPEHPDPISAGLAPASIETQEAYRALSSQVRSLPARPMGSPGILLPADPVTYQTTCIYCLPLQVNTACVHRPAERMSRLSPAADNNRSTPLPDYSSPSPRPAPILRATRSPSAPHAGFPNRHHQHGVDKPRPAFRVKRGRSYLLEKAQVCTLIQQGRARRNVIDDIDRFMVHQWDVTPRDIAGGPSNRRW